MVSEGLARCDTSNEQGWYNIAIVDSRDIKFQFGDVIKYSLFYVDSYSLNFTKLNEEEQTIMEKVVFYVIVLYIVNGDGSNVYI